MEKDSLSSYATYRPDLSEARLLSIAHRKAVELNASQQTANGDPPQVKCIVSLSDSVVLGVHQTMQDARTKSFRYTAPRGLRLGVTGQANADPPCLV